MAVKIFYGKKVQDFSGEKLTTEYLKQYFADGAVVNRKLLDAGLKVAYFFMDPLLFYFEAGNQFYFEVLECPAIPKLNYYRTGAGPVIAVCDARELVESGLYDAVFLFGFEPLMKSKNTYGRDAVSKAMNIFGSSSLMETYNNLAETLCREYGLDKDGFFQVADSLYENYCKTLKIDVGDRGRTMENAGGDLFRLTDCANPNVDFAGGIVLGNEKAARASGVAPEKQLEITAASYEIVKASPDDESLAQIVGTKDNPFPHVKRTIRRVEEESGLSIKEAFEKNELMMELYTCYPPIPLGFLLAGDFIRHPADLSDYLKDKEITLNGGMSLGRAPWNNPVISSLVTLYDKLPQSDKQWGMTHGNGGVGESQGVIILKK